MFTAIATLGFASCKKSETKEFEPGKVTPVVTTVTVTAIAPKVGKPGDNITISL